MAATAVDTAYLAGFCGVPQPTLQALVEAPTTDLVTSFLSSLVNKAQEFEETKSEQRRLEVELETAVHSNETRAKGLKANADKALAEAEALRNKLNEQDGAQQVLRDQLQNLQSSTTSSTSEVETLTAKVAKLEASNRDTLALLDSKTQAHERLGADVTKQQTTISDLRREVSTLQDRLQSAENESSRAKFRESTAQRDIELLKKNNDWLNTELKTKNDDHSKFRKEKIARIQQLQRSHEEAESNLTAVRRTEIALRQRITELTDKLEDSFTKVQQMQEEHSRTQESFRAELDSAGRLAKLQEQSAATAKRRVQELEEQNDQTRADASDELSQMQAELETEREGRESAEKRAEELETAVERLEAAATERPLPSSRPVTPGPRSRGFGTPMRHASPSQQVPGSAQSRGGLTFTQLYTDFNNARSDLDAEKRRSANLNSMVEGMMADLEKVAPELEETRQEKTQLQTQLSSATSALDKVRQERDSFRKDARKASGEIVDLKRQEQLLRGQVRDREAQIRYLTVVLALYEEGEQVSQLQREQLERLAMADFNDQAFSGMTDTDRFISQRLVTFRSISELTETNSRLLDLTRKLGEQMEGDEAREKANERQQLKAATEKLDAENEQLRTQLSTVVTQSNSFIKERDMFRRMLENTKRMPANANLDAMFGESLNGPGTPRTPRAGFVNSTNGDQSPASRDYAEQMKLIKEMQSHFDAYKREAATDHSTLRTQIDSLAKERGDLQGEVARVKSQLYVAQERYDMLQANYNLSMTESQELQKRARSLEETNAKIEIRGQQTSEELVQSQELAEGLRSENANLKAEKELWRRIEIRLNEDNLSLSEERARLNKLVSDTQSLSNQREAADAENRRALQAQVETLDSELRSTRRKLEEETEEAKQSSRRRELDLEQSRSRQDDLLKSLSSTKEELASVTTSRDQLNSRVEELKIELRNAQERADALQPKPTPRPGPGVTADESAITNEQELLVQLSDLRRDLDLARTELESAHAHTEQYKSIAQSSEDELNLFQETQAQYTEDMDKTVREREATIAELQQRVQDISNELAETTQQLNDAQKVSTEFNSRLEHQKQTHDEDLARVRDEADRHKEAAKFHQQDLRAQAEIAQQAQQSYETELVRHADAAKALTALREELNSVKLEVSTAKANADGARLTLAQNEESWSTSRDNYERELNEIKKGRDDLRSQNAILHQQLEGVSAQIAELQQKRAGADGAIDENVDHGMSNLQEIISYLRHEKEIVDVQYDMSTKEATRLKQQLNYAQTQLDEARVRLDQERQRQADQERTSQSHSKMVETMNEINVYRESNASLRAESTRLRAQVETQTKKVQDLQTQIEPLQASLREVENQLEMTSGEIRLAHEDRDRWQKRTQDILQKYDRVDPAEHENLKAKVDTAEKERDEAVEAKSSLESGLEAQLANARKETREKLQDQFKNKVKELNGKIRAAEDQAKAARDDLDKAKEELQSSQSELETARQERDAAKAALDQAGTNGLQQQDTAMLDAPAQPQGEDGEVVSSDEVSAKATAATARADALQTKVTELESQAQSLSTRCSEMQVQLEANQSELTQLRQSASEQAQSSQSEALAPSSAQNDEHIQKLQADLEAAQAELAALQSSQSQQPPAASATDETTGQDQQEITTLRQQLQEAESKSEMDKTALHDQIQQLESKHREELATLASQIDALTKELEAAKTAAQSAARAQTVKEEMSEQTSDTTTTAAVEGGETQFWNDVAKWDNAETKKFMNANEHVKRMVSRNVAERVKKQAEELTTQHSAELEEAKTKATESAIEMESKKWKVKGNLTEAKLRAATARIEIVQNAADSTPERTVADVWAVAKNAKAAPAAAKPAAQTPSSTPQTPTKPQTTTAVPASANQAQPAPVPGSAQPPGSSQAQQPNSGPAPSSGIPRRMSQSGERPLTQPANRPLSRQGAANGTGVAALKGIVAQSTGLPQPRGGATPAGNRGGGRGMPGGQAAGRLPDTPLGQGPQALPQQQQQQQNSGIPRGGAASGIARGLPRAGARTVSAGRGTGQQNQNLQAGRGAGNMNPQAGSFTPQPNQQGAKRPREGSEGPGAGRATKVARGGGNASG